MRRVVDMDRERLEAVLGLLAEYPELTAERLRQLGEAERNGVGRRRTRTEAVRPRTTAEVVGASGGQGDQPSRSPALPAAAMKKKGGQAMTANGDVNEWKLTGLMARDAEV